MKRFLAACLMVAATTGTALACDATLPDHLRVLDCDLATALQNGAARSAVLHDLLERVDRADGLIYVTPPPRTGVATHLLGGFSHDVSVAGRYRILRVFVSDKPSDQVIAIVGHELRHALEVLELSNARTEAEVEALYDRIGWRTSGRTVETQAALDVGHAIERELRAAKRKTAIER